MEPKMVKYKDDECFGQSFCDSEGCQQCWIRDACHVSFKNRDK